MTWATDEGDAQIEKVHNGIRITFHSTNGVWHAATFPPDEALKLASAIVELLEEK